ncbi:glycosyltransferase family 4 protein [Algoriphagus limi]|uniref:Glycosyltransferase family 4 protein n=1 Tax=Algoriphagus limi TaxID=2975273 RepID=A0ABT2G1N4_9BACT|nr:glycosyltransferase family 4 protein [Algoriphagus limi]MCS5489182.1 glycosyltransferase family 4 protein [Algoriphagus limi]
MKLVFITNNFPPISCGVGDYTYNLAQEFVKTGHEVGIVCRIDSRISSHWGKGLEGITVYPIGVNWGLSDWKRVMNLLQDLKPDRVLLQYVPYSFSRFGTPVLIPLVWFILRLKKYNIHITYHEIAMWAGWGKIKYLPISFIQFTIAYTTLFLSKSVFVSTQFVSNQLQYFYKSNKIAVVPIGGNFPFNKVEKVDSDKIIICTAGLSPSRNVLLIKTFCEMAEEIPFLELWVLGKYNEKTFLKVESNYAASKGWNRIVFTGVISSKDFAAFLSQADFFCFIDYVDKNGIGGISTKSSILPSVLNASLPIIGTKGSLTDDFFYKHGCNIHLVDYDQKMLKEAILKLFNDKKYAQKLGENAFYTFKKFMSWEKIVEKYLDRFVCNV